MQWSHRGGRCSLYTFVLCEQHCCCMHCIILLAACMEKQSVGNIVQETVLYDIIRVRGRVGKYGVVYNIHTPLHQLSSMCCTSYLHNTYYRIVDYSSYTVQNVRYIILLHELRTIHNPNVQYEYCCFFFIKFRYIWRTHSVMIYCYFTAYWLCTLECTYIGIVQYGSQRVHYSSVRVPCTPVNIVEVKCNRSWVGHRGRYKR